MYSVKSAVSTEPELGAHLFADRSGASFRVWAPNASAVNVRLAPSDGEPFTILPFGQDAAIPGYWSVDITGVAAGHLYQFDITNEGGDSYDPGGLPLLRVDPCARQVLSSDRRKPALVVDTDAYAFTAPFDTPKPENFIIYQAHVGSFIGRGDGIPVQMDTNGGTARFDQLQTQLRYIAGLRFNAIQFLPTGEYRGSEGEAYNPSNYYAPEVLYGTPDELKHLVDACHRSGLAVFFDVVYNHMDGTDNLWQFDGNNSHRYNESDPQTGGGIYFSSIETDFGIRPNHDSPDVQRFFRENAEMWFDEYHVDGLRFDSAVNFSEGGLKAIVQPLIAKYPGKFLYAEDSDTNYVFNDIGFRACWAMGSADDYLRVVGDRSLDALLNLVGRFGYPTAWSAIKYLLGSHDQIFNNWRYDDQKRQWVWDKPPHDGLPENRYVVEKIGGAITGRDNWYARAQARLGWALNVAIPCTPMLFMGNECLQNGYWNPELDPFGDHRFDWGQAGDSIGQAMQAMVRDVNGVRWDNPALRTDSGPIITQVDSRNDVLAFKRWNDHGNVVIAVVNLSDNQWDTAAYGVAVDGSGDRWTEVFNSQSPQYGGWNDSGNYLADLRTQGDGKIYIRLPKWSVLIFRKV